VRQSKVLHWCVFSLVLAVLGADEQAGGVNPLSRFALTRAMANDHGFSIDRYRFWTVDWSQTPDGRHYSNKAPGPSFLALPFASIDRHDAEPPAPWLRNLISLLLQAVPLSILTFLIAAELQKQGASAAAQNFAAVAILYGNTAALFMGVYFGHALSAWLLLLTLLCWVRQRWFWTGMALGWLVLTDYGAALLLIPAAIAFAGRAREVALGAALPAALWIVYHCVCFGSPWALPMAFQNPGVIVASGGAMFAALPSARAAGELLWGLRRGLLFTQPWIPMVWCLCVARAILGRDGDVPRSLGIFSLLGLPLLFWMNAGFNGWHGGQSAGPRYMSVVFPLYGWLAGIYYDRLSRIWRTLLIAALGMAVLLRWLVQTKDVLAAPELPIWSYYLQNLQSSGRLDPAWLEFGVFGVLLLAGLWLTDRALKDRWPRGRTAGSSGSDSSR
jgi:hypothetical protein